MDVGDVINGWRIVEDAGAGRSGHVFIVCREGDPDRLFALKMQRTDRPDVAPDANAREAALLRAGMKKSPRVMPALVEVGEWRGVPFFVMERIEGIDFPIPARRYRRFCVEAFTALAELHSWLVHCDIAPCHLGRKGGGIAFVDFDAALPHAEAARLRCRAAPCGGGAWRTVRRHRPLHRARGGERGAAFRTGGHVRACDGAYGALPEETTRLLRPRIARMSAPCASRPTKVCAGHGYATANL